jgi:hypothetical protein
MKPSLAKLRQISPSAAKPGLEYSLEKSMRNGLTTERRRIHANLARRIGARFRAAASGERRFSQNSMNADFQKDVFDPTA